MKLNEDSLYDVVDSVTTAILGPGLQPAAEADWDRRSAVAIIGDCDAVVTIRCSGDFARRWAGAMFDLSTDELTEADVADALGELTNMTGGGVKSLLPGVCTLGLPWVASAAEAKHIESAWQYGVALDHDGSRFLVDVYGRTAAVAMR